MNHAQAERELRRIEDPYERYREWKIQRMQTTLNLDRDSAALALEYIELKMANNAFAFGCGTIAGLYVGKKLNPLLRKRSLLFRKPWMAPLVPGIGFFCAYYGAKELRGRKFAGKDASFESYSGANDVISRFRDTDFLDERKNDPKEKLIKYLRTAIPLNRSDIQDNISTIIGETSIPSQYKNKKVRRYGKDKDDIFWLFGKIHGLENIAFLSDEELKATGGNPILLQDAVNNARPQGPIATSFDGLVAGAMLAANEYKKEVGKLSLYPSDRAKLLALPFFCSRRKQGPAPQKGQWQYDLFTEIAGHPWEHYDNILVDLENKPLNGDFLPQGFREKLNTESSEFKRSLRMHNLLTPTAYERHKDLQEKFRNFTEVTNQLNEDEGRAFYHLIKNKHFDNYLEDLHSGEVEKKLAKIAETESYLAKNSLKLRNEKLDYVKKDRIPLDRVKVKDLFRHHGEFKKKFANEIGIYDFEAQMIDFDKKAISYFYNTASGPMAKLRDEIGLRRDRLDLRILRVKDIKEIKEKFYNDPVMDHSWTYCFNSLFLPLDVKDYSDNYIGPHEFKDELVEFNAESYYVGKDNIRNIDITKYKYEMDDPPKPNFYTTTLQDEIYAEKEEDDEEGEGEEEEDPLKPFLPLSENEEYDENQLRDPDWPWKGKSMKDHPKDEYFDYAEQARERYNDEELDSFMKLLDVKPFKNWRDNTGFQDRLGLHPSNDFAYSIDPETKMVGEVEREMFEKIVFTEHRRGPVVRFRVGETKPIFKRTDS